MRAVVDFSDVGVAAHSVFLRLYPADVDEGEVLREVLEPHRLTGDVVLEGLMMEVRSPRRYGSELASQVYLELWYDGGDAAYDALVAFLRKVPNVYRFETSVPEKTGRLAPKDLRLLDLVRGNPELVPSPMGRAVASAKAAIVRAHVERVAAELAPKSDLELLLGLDRTPDYAPFVLEYLETKNVAWRVPTSLALAVRNRMATRAELKSLWSIAESVARAASIEDALRGEPRA